MVLGSDVDWHLPQSEDLGADRRAAFEILAKMAAPSAVEEDWRYGPIDDFSLDSFGLAKPAGLAEFSGGRLELKPEETLGLSAFDAVVVLESGSVVGVSGGSGVQIDQGWDGIRRGANEGFELLNFVFSPQSILISLPKGSSRLLLVNRAAGSGELALPRVTVRVADGSTADVVEVRSGGDSGSLTIPVMNLEVGSNSKLNYTSIQTISVESDEFAYLGAQVGRDSELNCFHLALGGNYARLRTDCDLVGENSTARLLAGYIGGGNQVLEFRTFQNHLARHTKSELLYKGALADASHSIYSGTIHIAKGAIGSDAFQTNRNLVLDEAAHADSVPNLDIHENDVKCSHASAVGPVEEDQLYYLACRGIPPERAERILVRGFFKELAARGSVDSVETLIYGALEEKW